MSKPQTVIGKAKELQELHGKEYAIQFFKNLSYEIGPILTFEDSCTLSGYQTAIEWLEIGQEGMEEKARDILKNL
jgi:hypothetical protein